MTNYERRIGSVLLLTQPRRTESCGICEHTLVHRMTTQRPNATKNTQFCRWRTFFQ